jgi:hypothetical protein
MTDDEKQIIESLFPGVPLSQDQIKGVIELVQKDAMIARATYAHLANAAIPKVLPSLSQGEKFGLVSRLSGALRIPMVQAASVDDAPRWDFYIGDLTGNSIIRACWRSTTQWFDGPRPHFVLTRAARFGPKGGLTEPEQSQWHATSEEDIQRCLALAKVGKHRPPKYILDQAQAAWRREAGLQ